jgi:lysozyme family protein
MADFAIGIELVVHNEGGYWKGFSSTFKDPGGETYMGIARNFHPDWKGWVLIDKEKEKGEIPWQKKFDYLRKDVEAFYLEEFWNPLNLSEVNDQSIANSIFDLAVNLGAGRAVGMVQMMLNQRWGQFLMVDTNLGPKTLEVLNRLKPVELNNSIFKMRVRHHMKAAKPEILKPLIERSLTYLVG